VLAATPAWFSENLAEIASGTLLVLTVVVLALVKRTAVRLGLLALIAAVALFSYVNRAPLEACARTCACSLGGRTVTVPSCDPALRL
jgi:hypothetical protein